MNLAEMSLVELGFLLLCEDCPFDRNQIKFELARRQRMLEAAKSLAEEVAVLEYHAALTAEPISPQFAVEDINRCREALNAYAAAKAEEPPIPR